MLQLEVKHVSTKEQKTQTNITFSTEEKISDLDKIAIEKGVGVLLFQKDFLADGMIEAMRDTKLAVDFSKQSPSKVLRGKLYEYWYKNVDAEEWELWYKRKMDGVIEFMTKELQ